MTSVLGPAHKSYRKASTVVRRAPLLAGLAAILVFAGMLWGRSKETRKFTYVGGNQTLLRDCAGDLQLKNDALTFRCPDGSETIPYASIEMMEYRPSLSPKIRKMAPHWAVVPSVAMPIMPKKHNRFFAVVYTDGGVRNGMVLEVSPQTMQPYVAEIELKSNKRVEVYSHEEYY